MSKSTLSRGDIVSIYDDPLDCTSLEGIAELVELVKDDSVMSGLQYWRVEFDDAPGEMQLRAVNVRKH